ncbi:MAG TPA: rod shape-determining protein MreC, partial [Tepidiformaceae bacterium]|nr:rod shape-determining protein MreC [Tepidiformaceae bacterium]
DLRDQNAELRLENERLQVRVAELQDEAARVADLEDALGITSEATAEQLLPANVTARDSTIGHDVIRINVGSEHGIVNGQVVLSANGALIGTVTKVLPTQANVQLLSDSRSIVNAEIETSRIQGNVAGTLDHKLTFNRAQGEIKVGERVVTSGLGGLYPPGKVIGIVSEVSGTPQDLFRSVKVEPIVRLSTVETVLVITNFLPQRIDLDE